MAKTSVKIVGASLKDPKVNKDGSVELLFKINMSESVPKGLSSLGESIYLVRINQKAWRKLNNSNNISKDSIYIIEGEPKACVNKKGVPYIAVVAFSVQMKDESVKIKEAKKNDIKNNDKELVNQIDDVKVQNKENEVKGNSKVKNIKNEKNFNWREKLTDDDYEFIDVNDVDIDNPIHYRASFTIGDRIGKNSAIVVAEKENGRYSLVVGLKAFVSSKIYRPTEKIKAYIYKKDRNEFMKEFAIDR